MRPGKLQAHQRVHVVLHLHRHFLSQAGLKEMMMQMKNEGFSDGWFS